MSTGAIVAIVVLAVLFVILLAALPRIRARRQQRELEHRRGEAVDAHRSEAELKSARADHAERLAQKERAEADLHESRARLHEQGLADDELDRDVPVEDETTGERRFARRHGAGDDDTVRDDDAVRDDETVRDERRVP